MKKLEGQAAEAQRHLKQAEKQVDELKQELQNVECLLRSQQDEMGSLNEQLTVVRTGWGGCGQGTTTDMTMCGYFRCFPSPN